MTSINFSNRRSKQTNAWPHIQPVGAKQSQVDDNVTRFHKSKTKSIGSHQEQAELVRRRQQQDHKKKRGPDIGATT